MVINKDDNDGGDNDKYNDKKKNFIRYLLTFFGKSHKNPFLILVFSNSQ